MPRKARTESLAGQNAAPGGAAAVDRALSLLAAFRSGDTALPLAVLAERTQLYKSTALRLLASLEHAGLLHRQPDGQWALGAEVARLHHIYATAFSLERVVLPVLQALVRQTGESAAFHVREGAGPDWVRRCLYRVDSPHMVRDHIRAGDLLPTTHGAGARVLIANSPDLMAASAPKDHAFLATVQAQGYCALVGDRSPDLGGISAPVWQTGGELAGAVTLTMPAHRYDPQAITAVVAAARQLGKQL
jgi:DNA-binding IclR family transcriptional regulator